MTTKDVQNKFIHFMQMLTSSGVYIFQEVHSQMKTSMIKRQTKLPLVDPFVLMLQVTTDQFSEFDRICVDQGLEFVLEGHVIFYGMPSNSSMVFTLSTDIMLFWI